MKDHGTRLLFDMFTDVPPPIDLRDASNTGRLIYNVAGGTFEGDRLRGVVLPTCGDWVTVCPGGRLHYDARLLLRTDDEALIYANFCGDMMLTEQEAAMLQERRLFQSADTSYTVTPVFETCAPQYAWLKDIRSVCYGHRMAEGLSTQFVELP